MCFYDNLNCVYVCVPELVADWRNSAVCLPVLALGPLTCCPSCCTESRLWFLSKQTQTQTVSSCLGNKFNLPPCQSLHPFVHLYYFSVTSAESGGVSFLLTVAAFGLQSEGKHDGWQWQLHLTSVLTHKNTHVCPCRLTGCDMDNSLRRSHQHTPVSSLGNLCDTHTDTERH